MTNAETKDPVRLTLLVSQIITASLLAGPIPLLLIGFLIGPLLAPPRPGAAQPGAPAADVPDETFRAILGYAAMGAGAVAVLMSFIVPRMFSAAASPWPRPRARRSLRAAPTKEPSWRRSTFSTPSCFLSFNRSSLCALPSSKAPHSSQRLCICLRETRSSPAWRLRSCSSCSPVSRPGGASISGSSSNNKSFGTRNSPSRRFD